MTQRLAALMEELGNEQSIGIMEHEENNDRDRLYTSEGQAEWLAARGVTTRPTAYYAHCVAIYNTPQEARDVGTLTAAGFTVINPNNPQVEADVQRLKDAGDPDYMAYFRTLVDSADVFAFRALPDGRIPAGVAKEYQYALDSLDGAKPIIELPSNVLGRKMGLDATRAYLAEVGQR